MGWEGPSLDKTVWFADPLLCDNHFPNEMKRFGVTLGRMGEAEENWAIVEALELCTSKVETI